MSTPEKKKQDAVTAPPDPKEPATPPDDEAQVEMSEEDEAIVLQRLRELGYVD